MKEIKISLHLRYDLDRGEVIDGIFDGTEPHLTWIGNHGAFTSVLNDTDIEEFVCIIRREIKTLENRIEEIIL